MTEGLDGVEAILQAFRDLDIDLTRDGVGSGMGGSGTSASE